MGVEAFDAMQKGLLRVAGNSWQRLFASSQRSDHSVWMTVAINSSIAHAQVMILT